MKLLIVEDQAELRDDMIRYLSGQGYVCDQAGTYRDAMQYAGVYDYDCVLLDLNLPDGDGLDLLRFIKREKKTDGVIVLSARDAVEQRIEGLDLGADDYLTKPFHLSELNSRIMAVIRRRNFSGNDMVQFHEITIDVPAKQVTVHDKPVYLTRKEHDMLLYFIANSGKVVSRAAIAEHIWGSDADMADTFNFLYTHIRNIRKKLTEAGANDYFQSVYGAGYKFVAG